MLQVLGVAIATLICFFVLRENNPIFAFLVSVAGICVVSIIVFFQLKSISSDISEIVSQIPSSLQYVKLMIKVLLISIITQLTSDICRDNGENSLAGIIEIASKILIVSMVLPLFKTIITLVLGLLK